MLSTNEIVLQEAVQAIADAVGEDYTSARRKFRHWAGLDLIPATSQTGRGVGTRRRYDLMAVLLGATLTVLARHGIRGDGLIRLGNPIDEALRQRGIRNIQRDGTLLVVDLAANGTIRAHLAQPGAPAQAPRWAQVTINVGEIALRLSRALKTM